MTKGGPARPPCTEGLPGVHFLGCTMGPGNIPPRPLHLTLNLMEVLGGNTRALHFNSLNSAGPGGKSPHLRDTIKFALPRPCFRIFPGALLAARCSEPLRPEEGGMCQHHDPGPGPAHSALPSLSSPGAPTTHLCGKNQVFFSPLPSFDLPLAQGRVLELLWVFLRPHSVPAGPRFPGTEPKGQLPRYGTGCAEEGPGPCGNSLRCIC